MLRSLEDVIDAPVMAADGDIGKVCSFLFDDQSWMIRYLVVDVKTWLTRRDVVISVSAINKPVWKTKTFRAHLTKKQVRHSPNVDSKKPVSRQQEIAMREHYGWPAWWEDAGYSESTGVSLPAGRKFPVHTKEDPHMRSTQDLIGYEVRAKGDEIGLLESFIMDETSWHIGYLDVKTGDWLHGRSMLVPTRWVVSVSWANHRVNLHHAWKQV
jgi:hypothetical protein